MKIFQVINGRRFEIIGKSGFNCGNCKVKYLYYYGNLEKDNMITFVCEGYNKKFCKQLAIYSPLDIVE